MGSQSVIPIKTQKDRKEFVDHLLNDLDAFEYMLQHNLFEKDIQRIGAEQELCIVDKDFRPSTNAIEILKKINDDHYTTELALFNFVAFLTTTFEILSNKRRKKTPNITNKIRS